MAAARPSSRYPCRTWKSRRICSSWANATMRAPASGSRSLVLSAGLDLRARGPSARRRQRALFRRRDPREHLHPELRREQRPLGEELDPLVTPDEGAPGPHLDLIADVHLAAGRWQKGDGGAGAGVAAEVGDGVAPFEHHRG